MHRFPTLPVLGLVAALTVLTLAVSAVAAGARLVAPSSTIRLVQAPSKTSYVDLGPKGPSAGDELVLHAALLNSAGKTVGHAAGSCVLLDPASQSYQCVIENVLASGTLIGTGAFTPGKPGVVALAGTGAYAGVHGQLSLTPKNKQGALNLVFQT